MKLKCILFEIQSVSPPLRCSLTEEEMKQLADTELYHIVVIDNPMSPVLITENEEALLNQVHFSNAGGIVTVR